MAIRNRRDIYSATLAAGDAAIWEFLAVAEFQGNRSAALRSLLQRAGRERGLVPVASQATQTGMGEQHAQQLSGT